MRTIFIVIRDYTNQLHSCLEINNDNDIIEVAGIRTSKRNLRRALLDIEGLTLSYLMSALQSSKQYRLSFFSDPTVELLWLRLQPPNRELLDYKWNDMVTHTLWEHIEMEHLMSWLSTLGGGFSALGEQFTKFAKTAGNISLGQLSIGLRLGDPFLQARCKLYYSLSLIQTGRLRPARHLIEEQYKFAIKHKETDSRLVKMCVGIHQRLRYEYQQRRMRQRSVQ